MNMKNVKFLKIEDSGEVIKDNENIIAYLLDPYAEETLVFFTEESSKGELNSIDMESSSSLSGEVVKVGTYNIKIV